jgi:chromatin remodeling complex protein RSC6
VKPTRITNELATFLGKSHGTLIARTEVSREINKYIRANSLQDKSNGRKIIPDEKLSALLNISAEDELTYFNLQRFMKHHFIKESKVVAAASMQA